MRRVRPLRPGPGDSSRRGVLPIRAAMWLNAVFLGILAVSIALGAWRGALATGLAIATLALGYAAAVLLGPPLAPPLGEALGVGPWLALPLASGGAFLVSYAIAGGGSALLVRWARRENRGRSPGDRLLGGSFGAVRGLLVALLIAYLAMWLDALRATGGVALVPEVGDAAAARLTGGLVARAIEASFADGEPAARVAARLAARPAGAALDLQGVVEAPSFSGLREDEAFWTYVEHGNVDAALNRGSFRVLQYDGATRHKLASLGLVSEAAAADATVFRDAVGEVLREVGPRLRGLREDPAFRDLVEDPEVTAMLQSGDTLGLLRHPRFRALIDRLTSAAPQE